MSVPPRSFAALALLGEDKFVEDVDLELTFTEQPVVGYRIWAVRPVLQQATITEQRLVSVGARAFWQPRRRAEAVCLPVPRSLGHNPPLHRSPWPGCDCGLWALKDVDAASETLGEYAYGRHQWVYAIGTVNLWGRIVECERGYRAEYAYPQSLRVFGPKCDEVAAQLERDYLVPAQSDYWPTLTLQKFGELEEREKAYVRLQSMNLGMPNPYLALGSPPPITLTFGDIPDEAPQRRTGSVVGNAVFALLNAALVGLDIAHSKPWWLLALNAAAATFSASLAIHNWKKRR